MRLTVVVPPDVKVPGLEVKRDGVVLHEAQWGIAVPVDAGKHLVITSAPGSKTSESTVDVAGEGKTTTVTIAKLEPAPTAAAAAPAPGSAPSTTPSSPPPDSEQTSNPRRTIGIVVGAVGVVGVAIGAGFGFRSISKHNDYMSHCVDNV